MSKLFKFLFTSCLLLTAYCSLVTAQTATATLSGTVEDQAGAALPGAAITIQNKATSFERTATTGDNGSFTVPLLPPGTYSLIVRRDGFTAVEVPEIVLNVADQKAIRVELKVGDARATVEVRPDENLISTSPAVANVIDRMFMGNLPVSGRSFQSLILLTPGVTVSTASNSSDIGQFSVNGQRASTNYFTVDGVSANIGSTSGFFGGGASQALAGAYPGTSAFGGTNNLVSQDAVEEFKIQTSSYTAELGRQPGGQVQVITRSGGNNYHGSAFEYIRNEAFEARNYFNMKPEPKPPLRQNQFGGTFSGPFPFFRFGDGGPTFTSGKDRTFFFFSYEGQRLMLPISGITDVPSMRLRENSLPALRPILEAFPLPTGSEFIVSCLPGPSEPLCTPNPDDPQAGTKPSGFAPYNYGIANPSNLDSTSIRIDHIVNRNLTLFGRFNESPSDRSTGFEVKSRDSASTRTFTLGGSSVLGAQINNEIRFNYSRQRGAQDFVFTNIGGAVPIDSGMLTGGLGGFGNVAFAFNNRGASLNGGTVTDSYQTQINIVDNFSFVVGGHSLKFGVDFRRLTPIYGAKDAQIFFFDSEGAVGSGEVTSLFTRTLQSARPQFENYSLYGQDTWRANNRLTLDMGLRWEFNPKPTEADGRMPPLATGIVGNDVTNATLAPPGTSFYKSFYKAFAPRIGAAFQLGTKPGREMILRGGFGVYYDLGSGTASLSWPFDAIRVLPDSSCPSPIFFPFPAECVARPGIVLAESLPTTLEVKAIDEDLKLPYSLHWNLSFEQAIGKEQSLSVSYVASAGRSLITTQTLNERPRDPQTGNFLPRQNSNFGVIRISRNGSTSDYHSMQAQYKVRFRKTLQALLNYTWSHAIDEVSNDIASGILERGNADFDVRHNFSAALHYEIPTIEAGKTFEWLLRHWSLSTIIHAQSGRPLNIATGGRGTFINDSGSILSARPDVVPGVPFYIDDPTVPGGRRFNTAAFSQPPGVNGIPSVPSRQGTLGRNILRELPIYQMDIALARSIPLREHVRLELKGEVFNLLNHPMFGNYHTSIASGDLFGVPRTTMNNSLGGFSSLYQLGGPRSMQFSARVSF